MSVAMAAQRPRDIFRGDGVEFSPLDRLALADVIGRVGEVRTVVEIGSWAGTGSTATLVEVLRDCPGARLYCVDTWRGNPNVARHQELVERFDMFGTFMNNVASYGGDAIVRPLVMSSTDAAAIVGDGTCDLVFIDADHAYDAVTQDIAIWRRKLRAGGVLCGHDCEAAASRLVDRQWLWEHRHIDAVPYSAAVAMGGGGEKFLDLHPGVVLAVGEAFGDRCHLWAEEPPFTLPDGSPGHSSVWDIQLG